MFACALSAGHASTDPKASRFYEDALQRFEAKDYAGAVIQLKNALQIDSNQLPVQVLLGRSLLATSDVAAAEVAFSKALELGVSRSEVVLPLASAVMGQGRLQELIDQPRFALDGLPPATRLSLTLLKAAARSDMGDQRGALQLIQQAQAGNPRDPAVWRAEVPVRIRAGQLTAAVDAARRAVDLAPADAQSHYLLGSAFHVQNRVADALAAYGQALARDASHAEALIARAGLHLDTGRVQAAAADVAAVQREFPLDPRAAYLAAQVASREGNAAEAKERLNQVASLLDQVPPAFLRFKPQLLMLGGLAHHGLGNFEKAKPYLEGVVRAQGNVAAAKLLAQIHLQERNPDRAITALEGYLKVAPADVQAIELLATAQEQVGRMSRALGVLRLGVQATSSTRLRAALGLALLRAGEPAQAQVELEAAWRQDPRELAAGAALAQLYGEQKQFPKAIALADRLVDQDPRSASLRTLQGSLRYQNGDLIGARTAFAESIRLDATSITPLLQLARLEAVEGRRGVAVQTANRVFAIDAKNIDAMLLLASIATSDGRPADTVKILTGAIDVAGPDVRPALALMAHHLGSGDVAAAVKIQEQLGASTSDDLAVLLASIRTVIANKDLASARSLLSRASLVAGSQAEPNVEIALLNLAIGETRAAAYNLEKALGSDPNSLRAAALQVDVLLRERSLDQALTVAQRIAREHPRRGIGHLLVGNVHALRGEGPRAIAAYRQAHATEPTQATALKLYAALLDSDPKAARAVASGWLKDNPKDLAMRNAMADGFASRGQFTEAKAAYESVLSIQPSHGAALNNLANVLLALNDPTALTVAERALQAAPGNPAVIDTVGWAAFRAGQKDRALQLLREARLRAPENLETRYHLATVLADAGRVAEARQELQYALSTGRAFGAARDARQLLDSLE